MTASDYEGMRWFKCDLHVHTPEDAAHWNDENLRLQSPRTEENLQEVARGFLSHCHDLALDCIAITDHNFTAELDHRHWLLTHLIEQNKTVAEEKGRPPIVIFPGFELDIRYHVLCLTGPVKKGSKLQQISDTLTNMGLPPSARFANGTPQQPKHQGRCWSLREVLNRLQTDLGGIVIAGHAFSSDGLCDDTANIPDFRANHDLYAVEVNAWPPTQKAQFIIEGLNADWKRQHPHHPPAPIIGSDGKSFDGSSLHNAIGCRYAWIKMSNPSCESLRQAFLDWQSRICLNAEPPEAKHTQIKSIRVAGSKFLQDQDLTLSPHLNCIIGVRGSGKSLLFESLRLGLRGEQGLLDDSDNIATKQVRRLKSAVESNARIELNVLHHSTRDQFIVDPPWEPARIQRSVTDAPTVFRRLGAIIFSQEEITQLADRQRSLLEFIDSFASDQLAQYRSQEQEIKEHLSTARQTQQSIERVDSEISAITQEIAELGRQLEAQAQIQEDLKRNRSAQEAQRYLNAVLSNAEQSTSRLETIADQLLPEPMPLAINIDAFAQKDFLSDVHTLVKEAYDKASGMIRSIALGLQQEMEKIPAKTEWRQAIKSIEETTAQFQTACQEKGLTPQQAEQLKETELKFQAKQSHLQAKIEERNRLRQQLPDVNVLLRDLADCWRSETQVRQQVLNEIVSSPTMPLTESGRPIIEPSLQYSGDREMFLKIWGQIAPDRRTSTGRLWDRYSREVGNANIGDQLYESFQETADTGPGNPALWLIARLKNSDVLKGVVRQHLENIVQVIREKGEEWFNLMLTRIPDKADITLLRNDDSSAGSLAKNDLSTGQKNTAILSLLLARGDGPVLIDQPEDELDSEFLYRELVPLFRKAKMQRQLIIVTHNANIPVNADAELVFALKAEGGRGICRAVGGLDRQEVSTAVLDIMEGSEEAFRRRKEKYHF